MKAYRLVFIVIFLVSILVVLMETAWVSKGKLSPFDRAITALFSPFQGLLLKAEEGRAYFVSARTEKKEEDDLKSQLYLLKEQLLRLQANQEENKRLREILHLQETVSRSTIGADVISRDPSSWFHAVTINRGQRDGVYPRAGVLSAGGVVGHVVQVSAYRAVVLLILDPRVAVPVEVLPSGALGIAYGDSEEGCVVKYLPHDAPIKPGDQVITSGYGRIFVKGISFGTVMKEESQAEGLFKEAYVKPSADLGSLQTVLVFLP